MYYIFVNPPPPLLVINLLFFLIHFFNRRNNRRYNNHDNNIKHYYNLKIEASTKLVCNEKNITIIRDVIDIFSLDALILRNLYACGNKITEISDLDKFINL